MTDAELQQTTEKLVQALRRAKIEHVEAEKRVFDMKSHLSNLGGVVSRLRYDDSCSELIVGRSDSMIETVDPWPTYDDLKAAVREHTQLGEKIRDLQARVRTATGLDRELLS